MSVWIYINSCPNNSCPTEYILFCWPPNNSICLKFCLLNSAFFLMNNRYCNASWYTRTHHFVNISLICEMWLMMGSYRIRLQQGLIWFCYALWICYDIYHFIKVTYDRILIKVSSKFQDIIFIFKRWTDTSNLSWNLKINILSINNSKIMINCLLIAYLIFWFLWICINVRWPYVLKFQ